MTATETTVGSVDANADPRPPYAFRRQLDALEAALTMETFLKSIGTNLQPFGGKAWFVGRCPMPDHEDKTPSFYVYPPGRAWCYGCSRGGDLLKLFMLIEGWPADTHGEALWALADRFGIQLPRRPEPWHEWNGEKHKRRNELQRWRARRYQRRFYALFAADAIAAIEDERERVEEMNRTWSEMGALARTWAARSAARSMRGAE